MTGTERKVFPKEKRGERGNCQIDTIEESGEWKLQRMCMKLSKLEVTGGLSKAVSAVCGGGVGRVLWKTQWSGLR